MEKSSNRVLHFVWRAALAALVLCGPAVAQQDGTTQKPADSSDTLEEVVVTGIRAGLRTSLDIKRNSEQVVDAISAEDIGDFPDKNLGEALQRVTGVQIQRQSGEGRGVFIRGAEPGLNRVEINGSSVLSLTVGGGRDVDFRDLPVELVSRMEVVKSATPDMTEGGIGGTVRIFTRRPFDTNEPYLAGSAQMVYSNLAEEYDPKFALIGSRTFLDDTFGVLVGATYEERHLFDNQSRTTGWLQRTDARASGVTAFVPDIPRYLINRRETKRPALNTILEWRPTDQARFYAEGTYTRGKEAVADQLMQLSGAAGVIDASTVVVGPDNTITHYEVVDSPANRLALTYRNIIGSLTREAVTTALGGNWEGDRFRFDGRLTYAEAEVHNDEKNANSVITGLPRAIVDYNNSQHAPNFSFPGVDTTSPDAITQLDAVFNPRTNVQDEVAANFNVQYRPEGWGFITALKTGLEARTLQMDQVFFGETITLNGITNPALLPQIRSIVDQYSLVNDIPFFKTGDIGFDGGIRHWHDNRDAVFAAIGTPTPYDTPRIADTWDVEEETVSGYVQASFEMPDLGVPVSGIFGVRVVDTSTVSNGSRQVGGTAAAPVFAPATEEGGYTKFLPSMNVRLNLIPDKLQGRLTAGRVLARPPPQDLAIRQTLDIAGRSGSLGNPDLQPFEANQYDAGLEWYFSDESYAAATYFRKEISSFITNELVEFLAEDGFIYTLNRRINGTEKVTINGIEAGAQYVFDFLPQPFDGFGALANVTYQEDSGYRGTDFFTGEQLPFPGLSRTSYNASLYFENQRFGVRASYNWRDDYLITPRGRGNNPEFGEAFGSLDASASFNLTDNTTFFFEGINLTDEVRIENANSEMRRTIIETFGRRYFAGVRMRL
jgi:TonB-dependent receptor